jgi:hypothetical protein
MGEADTERDLEQGTKDVAEKAGVFVLAEDGLRYLETFTFRAKVASVEIGDEAILTYGAKTLKIRRVGIDVG